MDIARLGSSLFRQLLVSVYPPRCVLCGAAGFDHRDICRRCYRELPWIVSACTQCAIPLAGVGRDLKCGHCLQTPPAFDHGSSLFIYSGNAIKLIHQLKFNEKLANARLVGSLFVDHIRSHGVELPDCILPVPLNSRRLRQRGYNQSLELARPLAKAFDISLDVKSIRRVRDTRAQTGLDRKQRRKNIRAAFELVRPVNVQHIALLDDVVTTASTVNELARLLKRGGVRRVDVWSIARAL